MVVQEKINKTISLLLYDSGFSIKETDLSNYYGEGITELLKNRNKIVHRYPVIIKFPVGDDVDINKFKKLLNSCFRNRKTITSQN